MAGVRERWAQKDKTFRLNKKNVSDDEILSNLQNFEKTELKNLQQTNIQKFEKIIQNLGSDILSNTNEFLTDDVKSTVEQLKKDLFDSIKKIKTSDDKELIDKLKSQLKQLDLSDGMQKLVPTEGIVFVYNGKTYKLTGIFPIINRITSLAKSVENEKEN